MEAEGGEVEVEMMTVVAFSWIGSSSKCCHCYPEAEAVGEAAVAFENRACCLYDVACASSRGSDFLDDSIQ